MKILIHFNLTGDLAERFSAIEEKLKSKPGIPPTKATIVKALWGVDPYHLLDGNERAYLAGEIDSLDIIDGQHVQGSFSADAPIQLRNGKVKIYKATKAKKIGKQP